MQQFSLGRLEVLGVLRHEAITAIDKYISTPGSAPLPLQADTPPPIQPLDLAATPVSLTVWPRTKHISYKRRHAAVGPSCLASSPLECFKMCSAATGASSSALLHVKPSLLHPSAAERSPASRRDHICRSAPQLTVIRAAPSARTLVNKADISICHDIV